MTKSSYFLPVKTKYSGEHYAKLFIQKIVQLHRASISIISNQGIQFSTYFRWYFHEGLGSPVNPITIFHTQTYGQAKHTIHTLEDILRACVINFNESWVDNSYYSSI